MFRAKFNLVLTAFVTLIAANSAFADIDIEVNEEVINGQERRVLVIQTEDFNDFISCSYSEQKGIVSVTVIEFPGEVPAELYFANLREVDWEKYAIEDLDSDEFSDDEFELVRIESGSGNDVIIAYNGEFATTILAGGGDDYVLASDTEYVEVYGERGRDKILVEGYSTTSVCHVYGGPDSDWLDGYEVGDCVLEGDGGNDVILSCSDSAIALGGDGNDFIYNWAMDYPVYLMGGAGDDVLVGGKMKDTLYGDDDDDNLIGWGKVDDEVLSLSWSLPAFEPIELLLDVDVMADGHEDTMFGDSGADNFYATFTKTKARRTFKTSRVTQVINGRMVWVTSKKRAHELYTAVIETESVRDFREDDGDVQFTTSVDPIRF